MIKKNKTYSSRGGRLPGDPANKCVVERIIRVDQAGEYGAVRIYEGQLKVLGKSKNSSIIEEMLDQEVKHYETFSNILTNRRVRPTALMPIWHLAGFALGAGTALMGEKAAMACTVAVEEVIEEHYASQIKKLESMDVDEKELKETCAKFRQEELEHRDSGIEHGARETLGYNGLSALVKTGSRIAIWLSERI